MHESITLLTLAAVGLVALMIQELRADLKSIKKILEKDLATRQFGVRDRNTAKSRKAEHWSNSFG